MPTDFKNCYETLGLTPDADWRLVQSTYRQLLIRWHPDRHQENKVTADHAKQHFISLSTSFNALRDFQRQHKRLPLQSEIDPAVSETSRSYPNDGPHVGHRPDTGSAASNKPTRHAAELQRERLKERRRNTPAFDLSDEQLMDASLVKAGSRPSFKEKLQKIRSMRRAMTGLAIALVLLLAVLIFFILDNSNSNRRHNEAKRIVIENGPSEFTMAPEDILRGRTSK